MKSTIVDSQGNVHCPKCGSTQFTSKRTGKAKWGGVITLGVGVAAMPKRLKCQGCGENLKTGSGKVAEEWEKVKTTDLRVGDTIMDGKHARVIKELKPGKHITKIKVEGQPLALRGINGAEWDTQRSD